MRAKIIFLTFFSLLALPTFAVDMYWTGAASSEFNNAGNWTLSDRVTTPPNFPGITDNVFFGTEGIGRPAVTSSGTINFRSITATVAGYTLNANANVYGDIILNGNLTFTGNRAITMTGTDAATIAFGDGVSHAARLVINKPGSGVSLTSGMILTFSANLSRGLQLESGDFTSNGYDISVGSINFVTNANATITLNNCTLTTSFASTAGNNSNIIGSGNTYNTSTCNFITFNGVNTILTSLAFNSLTLQNIVSTQLFIPSGETLTVNTVNLNTPQWNIAASSGNSSTGSIYTISTIKFNQASDIFTPTSTPIVFNVDDIDDSTLTCHTNGSIANASINVQGSPITTNYISYMNCVVTLANSIQTGAKNDNGGNTGIDFTVSSGTNYYWIGGAGNWSDPTKWSLNPSGIPALAAMDCVPSSSDTVYFNTASATDAVNLTATASCAKIVWGGNETGTLNTNSSSLLAVLGDADFSGAVSVNVPVYFSNTESSINSFTLKSRNDSTYTQPIYFNHTGTYTLTSNLKSTAIIYHYSGKIVANGNTIDCSRFLSSTSIPSTAIREFDLTNSTLIVHFSANNNNGNNSGCFQFNSTNGIYTLTNSEIIAYPVSTTVLNVYGQAMGSSPYAFNKLTFNPLPNSTSTYTGALVLTNNTLNSINELTFNNVHGLMTNAGSFVVGTLTLSPQRTYTFANTRTITINSALNPRTGSCDQITLIGGNGTTQYSIIKNNTPGQLSVPSGVLAGIRYESGTDGTNLQVPNGQDNGNNGNPGGSNSNIDFTLRTMQVFYWVGGTGNWSDPEHWAIGNPADTYPTNLTSNPGGCVPGIMDTVYFNSNSFGSVSLADTVRMDNFVQFAGMTWTADAGAKQPVLYANNMTTTGFIKLAQGMTVNAQISQPVLRFTGTSNDENTQGIDTDGVNLSTFMWGDPSFNTGRYDLYGNFYFNRLYFISGSLYTHYSSIRVNSGTSTATNNTITQSAGKVVDLSNSTIYSGGNSFIININECSNFIGTGTTISHFGNNPFTINNNDASNCTAVIDTFIANSASPSLVNSGLNPIHITKATIISNPAVGYTLTGKLEIDTLRLTALRGTLNITPGSDIYVNEYLDVAGTPCDFFNIRSATQGTTAELHLPDCNYESYFLNVRDINAILPVACDPADKWIVYGIDQGNNTGIDFLQAPTTGVDNRPKLVSACKPYIFRLPGSESSFQSVIWYKNGVQITAANNQPQLAITDSALYRVSIVYVGSGTGCNSIIEQIIAFHTDFVWNGSANDNDWNNPANWDMNSIPDECSYVTIPGGLDYYPIIEEENLLVIPNIERAVCDIIEFKFGGEVQNTHFLTYNKALVDLSINSNQWYMLSASLRNTYSGDFYVTNHNPHIDYPHYSSVFGTDTVGMLVYMKRFDIQNPQTNYMLDYNWTNAFHTNNIELQAGQGFALFANPRGTDYLENDPMTFAFPKEDPIHYYWSVLGAITGQENINRDYIGRFIYEDNNGDAPTGGLVNLNHSRLAIGEMVLVGNPFMAQLDFEKFVADPVNTGLIYDEYKIATGVNGSTGTMNDFSTYKGIGGNYYSSANPATDTLTQYIAPMQSFIVYARQNGGQLTADIENHTETAPTVTGNVLKSSQAQEKELLYIMASRGKQKSHALLVHWNQGDKNFYPTEDSRKLFNMDERASTSVLVYLLSKDGFALDINTTNDLTEMIPIGIRTSQLGKITLSFSGMEEFVNKKIQLHDTKENRIINLSEEDEYSFFKMEDALHIENRFFISFEDFTGIENVNHTEVYISNPERNTIRIYSPKAIESIEILDMQGRILTRETNINNTTYDYQVNTPGVYMVRIAGQTKKVVVK